MRAGLAPAPRASSAARTGFEHLVDFPPPGRTRWLALANLWTLLTVQFSRAPWTLGPATLLAELWNSNLGFALCLGLVYGFNAYVNSGVFSASYALDGFGPMAALGFGAAHWLWLKAMVFSPFAAAGPRTRTPRPSSRTPA